MGHLFEKKIESYYSSNSLYDIMFPYDDEGGETVRVVQAYRFALDPTPAQERALRSHCGAQRFAYNWGLGRVQANLAQREAERSYGVPEDWLTPSASWSAWALRKEFNAVKDRIAPWWAENSKEAYASG
jgi:putative transposase